MSSIPQVSLEDTYTLMQLVRETALAKGRTDQAAQLTPVMNEMRELVTTTRTTSSVAASSGVLGQVDFKQLLDLTQDQTNSTSSGDNSVSVSDRNRLVQAMSSAEMSDLDIARQLGMSREEVNLVLNTTQKSVYPTGYAGYSG